MQRQHGVQRVRGGMQPRLEPPAQPRLSQRVGAASGLYFSVGEVGGVLGPMSMGALAHTTGDFDASLFMMFGVACLLMLILFRLDIGCRES